MTRQSAAEMLVEVVRTHMQGHLFHLTDHAHIQTIERHGLVSARRAAELGISPAFPGGNALTRALDDEQGLGDVVFLSFFNMGLMPKHTNSAVRNPLVMKIDAGVLLRRGVQVALGRANRTGTVICSPDRAYHTMEWEAIKAPFLEITGHRLLWNGHGNAVYQDPDLRPSRLRNPGICIGEVASGHCFHPVMEDNYRPRYRLASSHSPFAEAMVRPIKVGLARGPGP